MDISVYEFYLKNKTGYILTRIDTLKMGGLSNFRNSEKNVWIYPLMYLMISYKDILIEY